MVHGDLERQNVLIDPRTGTLAGVIDFSDALVGSPALDFILPFVDFGALESPRNWTIASRSTAYPSTC